MSLVSWWRHCETNEVSDCCSPLLLNGGAFYSTDGTILQELQFSSNNQMVIMPDCLYGSPVFYVDLPVIPNMPRVLFQSTKRWFRWEKAGAGTYQRSVGVLLCTLTFTATMSLALTIIMTVRYRRVPMVVRLAAYFGLVYTLVVASTSMKLLHTQFDNKRESSNMLTDQLFTNAVVVASFVLFVLLLLAQVRVTMDLFERRGERKLAMSIGLLFSTMAVVLWGVAKLGKQNSVELLLIAYLFQIAMYLLFAACVVLRCISVGRAAFSQPVGALTIITVLLSFSPAALFLADLAGWWLGRYIDDLMHLTNYAATLVTFFWVRELADIRQLQTAERPIGRRIYEFTQTECNGQGLSAKTKAGLKSHNYGPSEPMSDPMLDNLEHQPSPPAASAPASLWRSAVKRWHRPPSLPATA